MIPSLLFLIILSLILLIGAYLIWKSELPSNDKLLSIIGILGLYALVIIVNEAKTSSYDDAKYSLIEFERSFYTSKRLDLDLEYKLPLLNDITNWIKSSLGENYLEESNSYIFGLVIGEPKNGKTLAFQEYTKLLQIKKIPALYIDIKEPNSNIFTLLTSLKIANLNLLEESVERLNQANKIPMIIVDNIHNGFLITNNDYGTSGCPICEYLKILYDTKNVNILMISNRIDAQPKITSSKNIFFCNDDDETIKEFFLGIFVDEAFAFRVKVLYMPQRDYTDLETYLLDKINHGISDSNKKYTKYNIDLMLKTIGFSWDQLNEYVSKQNNYNSVEDFCKKWLIQKGHRYLMNDNVKEIAQALLAIIYDNNTKLYEYNKWISFGDIKKYVTKNLGFKIEETLRSGVIKVNAPYYKFSSKAALNAVMMILEKGLFILSIVLSIVAFVSYCYNRVFILFNFVNNQQLQDDKLARWERQIDLSSSP